MKLHHNLQQDKTASFDDHQSRMVIERFPPSWVGQRRQVGIVLPSPSYLQFLRLQPNQSSDCTYHALIHHQFDLSDSLRFDARTFVRDAIRYAHEHKLETVIAFDCFPTVLASIITQSLNLPGPSFQSAFLCAAKYFTRSHDLGNSAVTVWTDVNEVHRFPVIIKSGFHQFDTGNKICRTMEELRSAVRENPVFRAQLTSEQEQPGDETVRCLIRERQRFYFDWMERFDIAQTLRIRSPGDVHLAHIEEYLSSVSEQQVEVVFCQGRILVADTGDIVRGPHGKIMMFRTPWSLDTGLYGQCRRWLQSILRRMEEFGFRNGALDIEFARTQDRFVLMEVNCRYSFMGFKQSNRSGHPGCPDGGSVPCRMMELQRGTLRNLQNRTNLALGLEPKTLPTRDSRGWALLCAYCYTSQTGPLSEIINMEYLDQFTVENYHRDGADHPIFVYKYPRDGPDVTAKSQSGGYTRIGNFFIGLPDDKDTIVGSVRKYLKAAVKDTSKLLLPSLDRPSTQVPPDWLSPEPVWPYLERIVGKEEKFMLINFVLTIKLPADKHVEKISVHELNNFIFTQSQIFCSLLAGFVPTMFILESGDSEEEEEL